jgi:alpha-L-rhamnosidase
MAQQWTASFITTSASSGGEGDPAAYFRRDFELSEVPEGATLFVTAIGLVEPHLNGIRVGDEVLAPGWTSYRDRLVVSRYDVTTQLVAGANSIGAIVGQGWALGRLGWEDKRNHYSDRSALFLQLELTYSDRVEVIGSDETFRTGTGGVLANSIYDGESFDATLEPHGWDRPGFDDSRWTSAEEFDWPFDALELPIGPPIRRIENLSAVSIITTPNGKTVVDFGQNISGWVRISVGGDRGTKITLRHAEVMVDSEIDVETLRTAKATDTYVLGGAGLETWEPRFTFHGFRYVEVDGWPGNLDANSVTAIVVHSDMTRTGWLDTSNALLNQLHSNAVWSMRDNFVGVPTDCPQRDERLGWTGDINAFAPTAAFLYDVRGVLGSWLRDLGIEQQQKGFVPWVVPDILSTPSSPTALWSDTAVSLPWVLYREHGDQQILTDAYESMTTFIRDVAGRLDEHGLWSTGFQYGDWLDPDAPIDNPAGGKTDRHLVASAYLCKTSKEMAQTAHILGRTDDALEFDALANLVRNAFRREFVTRAGRIVNESATAYALAITFGILDPDEVLHAGDQLAALVAKSGYRISTGFAGTPLVTDALTLTGHLDEAYLLLLETGCPSFLYPVTMGATTIWERWDSIRPDGTINPSGMTSLNHYALGAVVDWMHRTIGGLSALEPGYRRMRIAPQPGGDLTSARLRHTTAYGDVRVAWAVMGTTVTLDISVPEGTDAEVILPLHPDAVAESVNGGDHHWEYELAEEEKQVYDLDTTLRTLSLDPAVWRRILAVFNSHFPGIPLDGEAPEAAAMSLSMMLDYIPGATPELKDEFAVALGVSAR